MYNPTTAYRRLLGTLIAVILSGIIYLLGILHITDPLSKGILYSISPMLSGVNTVQIEVNNEFSTVLEARTLANKYKALQEQNNELRGEVAQMTLIKEENQKLREQLGAPQVDQFKMAPAKVVSKDRELTIVYDSNAQIAKDATVVYKNNFVGKIVTANNRAARVVLATDPEMSIPVEILTSSKTVVKGILHGVFGTGMIVDRISQDAQLDKGDLVVIAKVPGLPAGVLVGELRESYKKESDLFQTAKVNSYIDFEKLDTVFIIQ
jgi:cell shape-determining protein MreC